jgi:hypothetical protein
VEAKQAEVRRWEAAQCTYRHQLETLSPTLHPFDIADSAPQTSAQVASHLQAVVEAIAAFAQRHQLPARPGAMTKVRKQVPALVDFWWQGVYQNLAPCILSPRWRQWVHECLLSMAYWAHQVPRTRCRRQTAQIQEALAAVRAAFEQHAIPQQLAPQGLAAWHPWVTDRVHVFQHTSSAVEGRNSFLAQMHHHHRSLPKQRSNPRSRGLRDPCPRNGLEARDEGARPPGL